MLVASVNLAVGVPGSCVTVRAETRESRVAAEAV